MKCLLIFIFCFSTTIYGAEFLIKFKKSISKSAIMDFNKNREVENITTPYGGFTLLKSADKILSLELLQQDSRIAYVEPNYRYYPLGRVVSDPLFKKQWGLHNIKRTFFGSKQGADINVVKGWELTKGSEDVVVAVVDSGIDTTHPDLRDNLWLNSLEANGIEGVDDDGNGFVDDVFGYDFVNNRGLENDEYGHGTHCAGVIGASHNDIGIAGVMKHVRIMGLKFFSSNGGATSDAIRAINYAVKNGAHVISNSWGGYSHSRFLEDSIKYAASKNVVFVAAAGNSYSDNDFQPLYPASYKLENVISVGSMSSSGKKSSFSNYGKKSVHLFAPGSNILSTVQLGQYLKMSGTSMAAPHVAGIVGLMLSLKEGLTPSEVKELLIKNSKKSSKLKKRSQSAGHVDAYKVLLSL